MNLFEKITNVRAQHCFSYDSSIIFVVKAPLITKAIGKGAVNIKKLCERTRKKIKIVPAPTQNDLPAIEAFVRALVFPVKFGKAVLNEGCLIISASPQSKANLIGRKASRLIQLKAILREYFDIKNVRVM